MKSEKRVLLLLAASAVVILLVTVLTLFSEKDSPAGAGKGNVTGKPTGAAVEEPVVAEHNILAMVKAVDTENGTMTLFDLEEGGEVTLTYGLAADIRSKYGNLTYAASLAFGDLVRVEYDGEGGLVRMQHSAEHWELHGVEEFSVTDSMLSVNGTNYKLTDSTVAYCEGEKIAQGEVKSVDRVNLCGIGSELLAIQVTKGHGSIKLVNCEEFQGAKVTFGDESHTLDGEPSYLVREGNYTVSVVGDENAAVAEITVGRNEQIVIDLYEYGGAPVETAEVRFKISPFSTVLRIDGEVTDYYEQDLVLEYGEHVIEAELGGYRSYKGVLNVSRPYQTVQINLPEREVSEVEDGAGDVGDGSSDSEDGDSTDTGEDDTETGETTGDGSSQDNSADDSTGLRFVRIGEAVGYDYDPACSTYILVPENAIVLIDGISLGATPVEFEKLLGTYTITLKKNGNEKEYTVTVEDDGEDVYWKFPME